MPLRIAGPDMIANHDHSGSDTDADLKGRRPLKMANSFNQSQPRADRPLDIIFMRFRITKINVTAQVARSRKLLTRDSAYESTSP